MYYRPSNEHESMLNKIGVFFLEWGVLLAAFTIPLAFLIYIMLTEN